MFPWPRNPTVDICARKSDQHRALAVSSLLPTPVLLDPKLSNPRAAADSGEAVTILGHRCVVLSHRRLKRQGPCGNVHGILVAVDVKHRGGRRRLGSAPARLRRRRSQGHGVPRSRLDVHLRCFADLPSPIFCVARSHSPLCDQVDICILITFVYSVSPVIRFHDSVICSF
jgi:hypothetical protein